MYANEYISSRITVTYRDPFQIKYNDSDHASRNISDYRRQPQRDAIIPLWGMDAAKRKKLVGEIYPVTSVNFQSKMDIDGTLIRLISFFQR